MDQPAWFCDGCAADRRLAGSAAATRHPIVACSALISCR
ncbi:hypothetical protein C4K23_0155 [Pseudomonas chlororaphis]|nr:hypothetical protein C4K23_0155 [Pseudomonas chlororaphis]